MVSGSTDSLNSTRLYVEESVPFYNHTVSHLDLLDSCKKLLHMVFPDWPIEEGVEFVQCKDGITNKRTIRSPRIFLILQSDEMYQWGGWGTVHTHQGIW